MLFSFDGKQTVLVSSTLSVDVVLVVAAVLLLLEVCTAAVEVFVRIAMIVSVVFDLIMFV